MLEIFISKAEGFTFKGVDPFELRSIIRNIRDGGTYNYSPIFLAYVKDHLEQIKATKECNLTDDEIKVLKCIGHGKTNKEISFELNMDHTNVSKLKASLLKKTDSEHIVDLIIWGLHYNYFPWIDKQKL